MMIEGGQSEGGDVQTKDMRTEINGGQDGNIEVSNNKVRGKYSYNDGGRWHGIVGEI